MKYFKNNNNKIFAYDNEQIAQGYGTNLTSITKKEADAINKAKEDEHKASVEYQLAEAKTYLADTDWIIVKISEASAMGTDVEELKTKYAEELIGRSEARNKINELEG